MPDKFKQLPIGEEFVEPDRPELTADDKAVILFLDEWIATRVGQADKYRRRAMRVKDDPRSRVVFESYMRKVSHYEHEKRMLELLTEAHASSVRLRELTALALSGLTSLNELRERFGFGQMPADFDPATTEFTKQELDGVIGTTTIDAEQTDAL